MRKKTPDEPRESNIASGWTVEAPGAPVAPEPAVLDIAEPANAAEAAELADRAPRAQLPNSALVFLGVFGGLYLLYGWIWLSWAQSYATFNAQAAGSAGSLGGALQQFVIWLAPLAPIAWFAAATLLNRGSMKKTALWVLIGAVVLLPLPIFSGLGA